MTLTDLFDIELPVIQAPMAGVQDSALALAVSNAGGLGSLPSALFDLDRLKTELTALKAGTNRPFNVNFFCHNVPSPNPAREAAWRLTLAPYYEEYGIDPGAVPAGAGRMPFSEAAIELLSEVRPAVVSFHFGLPELRLLDALKAIGCKVISSATTVDEALWLEARGVDAIIAQGFEAGGHRGMFLTDDLSTQIGSLALVPQIVSKVGVPVIAAGGIADPRGVAAALELGAAGVQVGSAYLLAAEATTPAVHRAALQSAAAAHTAITNLMTGRPARGIMNRIMRELGPMSDVPPAFPLASAAIAPLRAAAEARGLGDFSPLWCGQNAGGIRADSAAIITRQLGAPAKV